MSRRTTHHGGAGTPSWLDPLVEKGEVRLDWHFSKGAWDKAGWMAIGLGAWGIVTGYALFVLLWHERHHPWKFALGLVLAAIASFIVESTRGLILGHKPEKLNGPRLLITILTLSIVELFVVAVHSVAIPSADAFAHIREVVFGDVVARHVPATVTLVSLMGIWVLVGAVLAGALMFSVPETVGSARVRIAKSAALGAAVGAILAPLSLLVVVVVIRIVGMVSILFVSPGAWADHLRALGESSPLLGICLRPLAWLGDLWSWRPIGWFPVGPLLSGAALVAAFSAAREKHGLRAFIWIVLAIVVLPVLFRGFGALMLLLLVTALVWLVPAAAIGGLAPVLRRPSEDTRTWGIVALLAGASLTLLTLVRLASFWFLVPACLMFLTALLLRRGARLNEYWPLVGITAALVVAGFTWVGQLTFAGVLSRFHEVNDVDLLLKPRAAPVVTDTAQLEVLRWIQRRNLDSTSVWTSDPFRVARRGSAAAALVENGAVGLTTRGGGSAFAESLAVEALAREWSASVARGDPALWAVAAMADRVADLRKRITNPIAAASLSRLDSDVTAALARAELAALSAAAASATPKSPPGSDDRERLVAMQRTLKSARSVAWRTSDARAAAERHAADLAKAVAAIEDRVLAELERGATALEEIEAPEDRAASAAAVAATVRAAIVDWSTDDGKARLDVLATRAAQVASAAREAHRTASRRLLELCLCGSLGFWTSVGMLAGFSLLRTRGRLVAGADGVTRCFWGDDAKLRAFHDAEHGVMAANDAELFARLSRELLAPGGAGPVDPAAFFGFDPAKLAAAPPPKELEGGAVEPCDRRATGMIHVHSVKPEGASLVYENARRLMAYLAGLPVPADPAGTALRDELARRAAAPGGPDAVVAWFAATFAVRKTTPIATFLQSAGILPGAHVDGCEIARRRESQPPAIS